MVVWEGSGCSFCEAGWGGLSGLRPSENRKIGASTPSLATRNPRDREDLVRTFGSIWPELAALEVCQAAGALEICANSG